MKSSFEQPEPSISVVIPTHNRHESLTETLVSLSSQTLSPSEFEVVIVDDGSTDTTPEIASVQYPFALKYLSQENQGAAAARNRGAVASRGKLLVFIDDDITLDPGYLQAILDVHHDEQRLVTMGQFQPYLTGHDSAYAVLNARNVAVRAGEQGNHEVPFTECSSNNLAIERKDFSDLGQWQDIFGDGPTLWGDVEFGYRAWKQGLGFVRIADAELRHRDCHVVSLQSACDRAHHVSRAVHHLIQRHPEIEEHLDMFRDKQPITLFSDPPNLVLEKVFHQVTSLSTTIWIMKRIAHTLEAYAPESFLLNLIYRWLVSAYIFQGYRQGLRDLAKVIE